MAATVGMFMAFIANAQVEPAVIEYQAVEVIPEPRVVLIATEITWTEERIIEEIKTTFPEEPELAVLIAKCESGLNPNAINDRNTNKTIDRGIMQINSVHDTTGYDLFDVQDNLAFARKLYDESKWLPWVCWTKKLY